MNYKDNERPMFRMGGPARKLSQMELHLKIENLIKKRAA